MKLISDEECALQLKLLVCDLELIFKIPFPKHFVLKRLVWELCYSLRLSDFQGKRWRSLASCHPMPTDSNTVWEVLKAMGNSPAGLGEIISIRKLGCRTKKLKLWMRKGMFGRVGREKSEAENLVAKRASKHAVFNAKVVEEKQFGCTKNLMMRFSKLLSK